MLSISGIKTKLVSFTLTPSGLCTRSIRTFASPGFSNLLDIENRYSSFYIMKEPLYELKALPTVFTASSISNCNLVPLFCLETIIKNTRTRL